MLSFFRAPDGKENCNDHGCNPTTRGDAPAFYENFWRVRIELEPPDKERKRLINRPVRDHEPGRSELRLERQAPGGPFGSCSEKDEHDHGHKEQLAPENSGCGHARR